MAIQIQFRRGVATLWTSVNPTLAEGEMGLETDTGKFKVGNGSDDWGTLPYSSGPAGPQGDPTAFVVGGSTWTSASVEFANGSNVTLSADSGVISFYVADQSTHAHSSLVFSDSNGLGWGISGSTLTGSYSQSTHAHSSLVFSNSNDMTFGISGSTLTGSFGFTESTHAHTEYVFSVSNGLDWGTSGSTVTGSYSQSTHGHSSLVFSDSNGVGFGISALTLTASYSQSTHAHSAFVLSESNGMGWGTNGSTITGSYSQSTHAHSSLVFSNSNGVEFGTSGSTLTASYSQSTHAHVTYVDSVNGSQGTISIKAGSNITITPLNSTLNIHGVAAFTNTTVSYYAPFDLLSQTVVSSHNPASWFVAPFSVDQPLAISNLVLLDSFNMANPGLTAVNSTGSWSVHCNHSVWLFSRSNFAANSSQMVSLTSAVAAFTMKYTMSSTRHTLSMYYATNDAAGTTSWSSNSSGQGLTAYFTGLKWNQAPLVTTLGPGEYWMMHKLATSVTTGNSNYMPISISMMNISNIATTIGQFGKSVSHATAHPMGEGCGSASGTTNTMSISAISAGPYRPAWFAWNNPYVSFAS